MAERCVAGTKITLHLGRHHLLVETDHQTVDRRSHGILIGNLGPVRKRNGCDNRARVIRRFRKGPEIKLSTLDVGAVFIRNVCRPYTIQAGLLCPGNNGTSVGTGGNMGVDLRRS